MTVTNETPEGAREGSLFPAVTAHVQREKAKLGCQSLAQAIEAYHINPGNAGISEEETLPRTPQDLVQPPFGGSSFLRHGNADTIDPWGKSFQFQRSKRGDGTVYILVSTIAPDGTRISQFGIGPNADPK